ncbi:nucleolus and neural progenitor protein [Lacerta agilis]|uniref:nucleolus and neural progenitor protein n=1 Tax=Lacerta agilis TaxID=80427 RepID=UPI00141937B6|nr:nucleolus and neural progenitor protein [Lacerta agilis]
MAAPGASEAVWNRLEVPWPACSATVAVAAQHSSVRSLSAVLKGCHAVDTLLKNKAMVAEQSLLHSIMYSFHYQMSRHRSFRSLKQVEQCLKRLNRMNLEKPIQYLILLGPTKQKSENPEEALVPSQPVIEVILVKILGGCKLLLRLLECCCTAFLLSLKHLCLQEYILLNTVVLGLLSRLWIIYRGVLKSLASLYMRLFELLQQVSETHPRPYIKGFAFPSEIYEFLGTTYSEIERKMPNKTFVMKRAGPGWMTRRFAGSKAVFQSHALSAAAPTKVRKKVMNAQKTIDIGKPILVKRTNQDLGKAFAFDVKSLCKFPNPAPLENTKVKVRFPGSKKRTTLVSSKSLRSQHLKSFVSKFQEACTFRELSDTLRTTVLWCKSNKLGPEAFFLGMKLLKSRRLQHVETQGCSLQRKLGCIKATLCKYLTLSSCRVRPSQRLKAHSHPQRQMKRSRKSRSVSRSAPSCIVPMQRGTSIHLKGSKDLSLSQCSSPFSPVWDADNCGTTYSVEKQSHGHPSDVVGLGRKPSHKQKEATENEDDIDDIFKVIGL